ncbi:regulatory protein SipA [Myxacorys almedinensis]|uniref:DUF3148 domain-containing protein n=1 Tax=Myxacorys almedinensis A TaxID=2690445 RepID=A0A8J7Z1F9_9CYAN|nr:DUF3148 domain-containing protein [Myxacorys almedinensis]NDJ16031.1 DUF3148 domain-containing protein [Myxacorys almedinensis A]
MSKEFQVGSKVCLIASPPYVKTADTVPTLRPSTIIQVGEEGIVLDRRPGGYWVIRFSNGSFLLDDQYLEAMD